MTHSDECAADLGFPCTCDLPRLRAENAALKGRLGVLLADVEAALEADNNEEARHTLRYAVNRDGRDAERMERGDYSAPYANEAVAMSRVSQKKTAPVKGGVE